MMLLASSAALLMMTSGAPVQAGYEPLVQGRTNEAMEQLQASAQTNPDDPVVQINLGVAYARQGRNAEARAMFEAAMRNSERLTLETANGEWRDSRHLAKLALTMLARGDFRSARMAAR
jgi:predicted Zn-dependent protease